METFHETSLQAQDLAHYKQIVKELSSAKYQGRGYAYGGANKAGKSGEDANLRGSEWYVDHPVVPLSQIKFLFNIDMIGDNNPVQYVETNSDSGFALFDKINEQQQYFKGLNRGELAGNSDHYPFTEKGVPSILFENESGDAFQYYHTVYDDWAHAVFYTYEPLFKLVRDFVEKY